MLKLFQDLDVGPINDSNRDSVIKTINEIDDGGGTCIDLGLHAGLSALKTYDNATGGVMILLTDGIYACGGSQVWKTFDADLAAIQGQGVRVITIAFSNNADDKIETLAMETGGASFYVPDNSGPSDLNNAFSGALAYQPEGPLAEKSVAIVEKTFLNQNSIEVDFTTDVFASRDFILQLDFDVHYRPIIDADTTATIILKDENDNVILETQFDTTEEVYRNTTLDLSLGLHKLTVSSTNTMTAVSVKVKHNIIKSKGPLG